MTRYGNPSSEWSTSPIIPTSREVSETTSCPIDNMSAPPILTVELLSEFEIDNERERGCVPDASYDCCFGLYREHLRPPASSARPSLYPFLYPSETPPLSTSSQTSNSSCASAWSAATAGFISVTASA